MPDLGKEYHPLRVRRMGLAVLVLFLAGLVVGTISMISVAPFVTVFMAVFFVPFIFMGLSGLTATDWELDPTRPDQRSVEAKQARHLLRMRRARFNVYILCSVFFIDALLAWLLVGHWGWTYGCRLFFIPVIVVFVVGLVWPLHAARTVFSADMTEHRVFIENGLVRQKSTPRFGHYRITPFSADQVRRAVWSTNSKGENMYVHFEMVRPEEQVVYPIHQDTIMDEAAFKAFLQGKLEEKDIPSGSYMFPSDR